MKKKQEEKKERKLRYLNDTAFQIESLKWLAILISLAVYDMNLISKICLVIIFLTDIGATKYCFTDLALKLLIIILILAAFIADVKTINLSFITEILIVLIILIIAGYKYIRYYKEYISISKKGMIIMKDRKNISIIYTIIKMLCSLLLIKVFLIKIDETTLNLFIMLLSAEVIITASKKVVLKWAVVILQTYLLIIMLPFNNLQNLFHFISAVICTSIIIVINCIDLNEFFKYI